MTANQAKKIATDTSKTVNETAYVAIQKAIEIAAEKGEMSMWWYSGIPGKVGSLLEKEGYKITSHQDPREGSFYKVSWD